MNRIDRSFDVERGSGRLFVTTSWDDGHPLDLRISELLVKYGIPGTFYVPRQCDRPSLAPADLRSIASRFELGAHTLNHVFLDHVPDDVAQMEIRGSKEWIENTTGRRCAMFCPPRGEYRARHVAMAKSAGFMGLRTVELCSLSLPTIVDGIWIHPTSAQAYPHRWRTYLINPLKRGAVVNAARAVTNAPGEGWTQFARSLLRRGVQAGGVFHLWGHSWEIEETGQWSQLEDLLRVLSDVRSCSTFASNGAICELLPPA